MNSIFKIFLNISLKLLIIIISYYNFNALQLFANDKIKLTKSEISKLKKAEKIETKSKEKNKKATFYLTQITSNNIPKDSRKYHKLLLKSKKLQGQSLFLQLKAQQIRYEIYATKAYQFWTHFMGLPDEASYASSVEAEARKQFQQYLTSYNDALNTKDIDNQNNMLSESLAHINEALSKIIRAYEIYSEISFYSDETTRQQNLLKNKQLTEEDSINSNQSQNIANITPNNDVVVEQNNIEPSSDINIELKTDSSTWNSNNLDTTKTPEINNNQNIIEQSIDNSTYKYFIQIAACRVPLNKEELAKIYNPSSQIIEIYEKEWYKYLIGPFSNYYDASTTKDELNIQGAFIKKYK